MDELISDFLIETREGLTSLDSSLIELEKEPANKEIISKIFRVLHTIKGTCGFIGLFRLEKIAHAGEDIMDRVRASSINATPEIISVILEIADSIKTQLSQIEATGAEGNGNDTQLLAKVKLLLEMPQPIKEISSGDKSKAPPFATDNAELQALFDSTPYVATEPPPIIDEKPQEKNVPAQTIRVSIPVLEELMQYTSELVLARNQLMQMQNSSEINIFTSILQRLSGITTGLQETVMKTRMQPVGNAWVKLPRIVRDLNIELNKKIELKMSGEETELDRHLIELITDPLIHMVRNSADHGIETPEVRKAFGKPELGTINITAYHSGGYVIIEITDDGKGIDTEAVKQKAVAKGLLAGNSAASMTKNQILELIFKPGFSTAEKVTAISGRGVGMDVVKSNIEKINGTIELDSEVNKGTKFTIRIPLTLAIMPILKLKAGGHKLAIPQMNIREIIQVGPGCALHIESVQESYLLRLRGHLLPLVSLARILGLNTWNIKEAKHYVIICELGNYHFGLIVDKVYDVEEIVVKPISPLLKSISIYSGNAIIGDGSVILILDPGSIARTIGDISHLTDNHQGQAIKQQEVPNANFLMFTTGDKTPKLVPIEMISRLEEIDVASIEYSHGVPVVQYRGRLMQITTINPAYKIPDKGTCEILVASDDNNYIGLVTEKILDIVKVPVNKEIFDGTDGFLGSLVVDGRTCDVIDLSYYFQKIFNSGTERTNLYKSANNLVLLVDDSPFFRKFIPPELTSAGFTVTTVENASEAIKKLEEGTSYAAIVTDLNMPDISGQEFVNICRHSKNLKDIPIVALSAERDGTAIFGDGGYNGIDAFVAKTNHSELAGILSGLISHREPRV